MTRSMPVASGLPLLGSSLPLLRNPLDFLRGEYARLGPVFRLHAAVRSMVVLAGPEANRFATREGRDAFESWSFWGPLLDRMACPHTMVGLDGPDHAVLRKAYKRDLGRGVAVDDLDAVVERIDAISGRSTEGPVVVREYTNHLVSGLISRLVTGVDFDIDPAQVAAMLEMQRWQFNTLLMRKWPTPMLQLPRFKALEREAEAVLDQLIAVTSAQTPDGWFASMERVRAERPDLVDEGDVRMHHLLPFFAGVDTMGVTLGFVLQELLLDDALLDALRQEVDEARGDAPIPPADVLLDLPLVTGLKREALRLYPAAFGVYRRAARDFTFQGFEVKAGEDVVLFTTAAHTDPAFFEEPHRFDARRPAAAFKDGQVFAPYGKGPHACLGAGMAEVLLSAVIARWGSGWSFDTDPPGVRHPVTFEPTPSVARSFQVAMTPR